MTTHQVKYEGPSSLAVRVATALADAEGIDLTSADKPERLGGSGQTVLLALTVEGTTEAVLAAVRAIGEGLPAGVSITVEDAVEGR
ncbi:MAG: hypothetical protein M3179_03400 [Actinomycetota bacterium]|nr:hypothetical protein [Actinomycetota bacterium]